MFVVNVLAFVLLRTLFGFIFYPIYSKTYLDTYKLYILHFGAWNKVSRSTIFWEFLDKSMWKIFIRYAFYLLIGCPSITMYDRSFIYVIFYLIIQWWCCFYAYSSKGSNCVQNTSSIIFSILNNSAINETNMELISVCTDHA